MRWLASILVLLWTSLATAEPFTIALIGDPQNGTRCNLANTAWNHVNDSVEWIANLGSDEIAYAIFLGDLIDGRGFGIDCWCGTQAVGCENLDHPYLDTACNAAHCNDAQAIACLGGTPGWNCEWTRARALVDTIEAAGIPWAAVAGNHDHIAYDFSEYNSFFGVGQMSPGLLEQGNHTATDTAGNVQSTSFYHVFAAGGARWLNIGVGSTLSMPSETTAWVSQVIADHPRMPTIITGHQIVDISGGCGGAPVATYWCGAAGVATYNTWGTNSQVFLAIGGHIREIVHTVTTVPSGSRLLGMATDWSFRLSTIPATPVWQDSGVFPDVGPENGGGGVVALLTIDPVYGTISMRSYSPTEGVFEERYEDNGDETQATFWSELMPICGNGRFDLPAVACVEYVEPTTSGGGSSGGGY